MSQSDHKWAIVLAGGDGTRLSTLTTDRYGQPVPKQFCSLAGGATLAQETVERAAAVVPRRHIVAVVTAGHRRWWQPQFARLPERNVVVQPANRGTAIGLLLPLLHILERNPDARVVVLPSDHFVAKEDILAKSICAAFQQLEMDPGSTFLLGISPDEADAELGYVVPGLRSGSGSFRVARFLEKPDTGLARRLIELGALWNSFIIVARARVLADLIAKKTGSVSLEMRRDLQSADWNPRAAAALNGLFNRLSSVDFSRHVLDGADAALRVVRVARCGWSDLGSPRRLAACLARGHDGAQVAARHSTFAQVVLAESHARLTLAM